MGIAVDINIVEVYIKLFHPKLNEKLVGMGLSLSLFTLEWIVCLFTTTLPFYVFISFILYNKFLDARNNLGYDVYTRP